MANSPFTQFLKRVAWFVFTELMNDVLQVRFFLDLVEMEEIPPDLTACFTWKRGPKNSESIRFRGHARPALGFGRYP